ncbi:MAG: CBS domain-containing protein [Candidatus Odinarchaeota archaeon]|nr:CBS domain-containing protein [Candidatus Odinarchaeota archaeon]
MRVWEVMQKPPKVLKPDDHIGKARKIFRETGVRVIPVVDENGKLLGYLRRIDVIKLTSLKLKIPLKGISSVAPVKDFMVSHPIITQDLDIFEVAKVMIKNNLEAIPVVKSLREPFLLGVITVIDILRVLISLGFTPRAKTVSEVMTADFYKIDPDERIDKVWHKFVEDHVKAALVIKKDGNLWGILTPKDLIDKKSWMFARESERPRTPGKVKRFMTRGVMVVTKDLPIDMVARFIVDHDYTLLPVIDENGEVIGVITQLDLLRAYMLGKKPEAVAVKPWEVPVPAEEIVYAPSESTLQTVLVKKPASAVIKPELTVEEIMQKGYIEILPTDTLEHARNLMLRYKVNHLVVVDDEGSILGILSKRNIIRALGIRGPIWMRREFDLRFIEQVMTPDPPRISAYATIEDAANMMLFYDVDALLVEKNGSIVGIITKDDIVKAYAKHATGRAKVENIMQPRSIGAVHRHHSIAHVIRVMETNYLDAVVVVERNAPIGLISENRLVFVPITDSVGGIKHRRVVWIRKLKGRKMARYVKITPLLAEDFMIEVPTTISLDTDTAEAAKLMIKYDVDGLPVVDENGIVLGIVTKSDIIRELARTAIKEEEYLRERLLKLKERSAEQ